MGNNFPRSAIINFPVGPITPRGSDQVVWFRIKCVFSTDYKKKFTGIIFYVLSNKWLAGLHLAFKIAMLNFIFGTFITRVH